MDEAKLMARRPSKRQPSQVEGSQTKVTFPIPDLDKWLGIWGVSICLLAIKQGEY